MQLGIVLLPAMFMSGQSNSPVSNAPIVTPDVVDARGDQEVVVRVPSTGMHRLRVKSEAGTACSVADHLRGPFANDGIVGTKSCDIDLMLDAGLYKVRLTSPQRGKGKAKVEVTAFSDIQAAVRLDVDASTDVVVHPHTQITAWLHLDRRENVTLDVAGRTAGEVAVWRDGRWLETLNARHTQPSPRAGKAIHRWRIDGILDPGEYKLVVYGSDPKEWSKGPDEDVVFITRGAPAGGNAHAQAFTVPSWGFVQIAIPEQRTAAFVQLDRPSSDPFVLTALPVAADVGQGTTRAQNGPSCTIAPSSTVPACALTSTTGDRGNHVLVLEGAPGTTGEIAWGGLGTDTSDGYWPTGTTRTLTVGAPGRYFVTAPAFPLSMDAEPLGCAVDQIDGRGDFVRRVAVDAPVVSWTEGFERSFNYTATSTAVWVQIDKPGLYSISGAEATKASCEVFRIDGAKTSNVGNGEDGKCSLTRALGAGLHEVRFYGGRPGIQTLKVAQVAIGTMSGKKTPAKASCSFEGLELGTGRYRLTTSSDAGATLRAFLARGAPMSMSSALIVDVDPMRTVSLPLAAGAPVRVHSQAGTRLTCRLGETTVPSTDSGCQTPALTAAATLTLSTAGEMPVLAVVSRVENRAPPALPRYSPELAKLPTITEAAPLWMDFSRDQSRSMLVEVDSAGLYDLQTEGLLSTACRLRTPTVAALVDGSQNGRGRNCLVQAYLKQGTYLFTATAHGSSRGRAGIALVKRAPRDLGTLAVGDEVFFKVDAGELAQHSFDVKKAGQVSLSAGAQGATLSCRLDDHDGWPVVAVPSPCTDTFTLDTGRYILTELPLTVASRRRTSVVRPQETVILEGEKTHTIAINHGYAAQLGTDGKDAFSFTLAADLDVGIELDHGMQARLSKGGEKGARDVVDTVPPVGGGGFSLKGVAHIAEGSSGDESGEQGAEESESGEGTAAEGGEGMGTGEYGEGSEAGESGESYEGDGSEGDDAYQERLRRQREEIERARAAEAMAKATAPREVEPLRGHVVHLTAGTYVLETEHSRGDVAIRYNVRVGVRALAPGVDIDVPVPGRIDVVMPRVAIAGNAGGTDSGLMRIKTHGDIDVRCRLRDKDGALVAESADSGADWNCALAVPLNGGRYSLTIEAEALQPGATHATAAFLEAKDTGNLKDGDAFKVVAKVASTHVPSAGPDVVHDIILTSEQEFSCAAADDDPKSGATVDRHVSVRTCRLLLWPGDEKKGFRVFVWTPDRAASVKALVRTRKVKKTSGGTLDDTEIGRAHIEARGRYLTGPDAVCRAASAGGGALLPCLTATSFDAGDVLVGVPGGGRVSLDEEVARLGAGAEERRTLDGFHGAQRQRSAAKAVHLAQVTVPFGSASSPSCGVDGGVASHEAATCVAVTGPVTESVFAAWTRSGARVDALLSRTAAAWPASSGVLSPGASTLAFPGDAARWSLPADGFRVKLALPADAWAVSIDDDGHPRDVCAPHRAPTPDKAAALVTCVLRGRGGELFVASKAHHEARADLLVLSTAEAPRALVGLRETKPASPGRERLLIASSPTERMLRVEGRGALACAIHLDNGTHVAGCKATLPAGQGAEIRVEYDDRPWRVFTYEKGGLAHGRFGALPTGQPTSMALGTATALGGSVVDRRVDLKDTSAVRVRATAGVCAIIVDNKIVESQGLGGGCDLVRVLPKGSHRIVVRAFGTAPLSGNVNVSAEPVTPLADGVGAEALVAAGDARTFQFQLETDGEVGVGLQADADTLQCTLLDGDQEVVGDGCHQFHRLRAGSYFIRVEAPDESAPRRFKPVVFGLKGDTTDVPDAWLRDFFARIEVQR